MKKIIISLLLLFTTVIANAQLGSLPEKPLILIWGIDAAEGANTEERNEQMSIFEAIVSTAIEKEIKCAKTITRGTITAMIVKETFRVHVYGLQEDDFEYIMGFFKCDIKICLTITKLGEDYYLGESAIGMRRGKVSGKHVTKTDLSNMYEDMAKFAEKLVKDLLVMEICAYKGDLSFTSVTTFKDSEERTGLPNQDCEFKATKKEENKTIQTWTFKKDKRYQGSSGVNCTIDNSKKMTEHNTCDHCCKMIDGVKVDLFEPGHADKNSSTVITETYSATKTIPLTPNEYENCSALIRIKFDTLANNYTITVKAISEPGKYTKKTEEKNSGCPYDESFNKEQNATYPVSCDRSLGPFPGSPYQKSLKQTITRNYTDPDSQGKSKTTETITFNLTR